MDNSFCDVSSSKVLIARIPPGHFLQWNFSYSRSSDMGVTRDVTGNLGSTGLDDGNPTGRERNGSQEHFNSNDRFTWLLSMSVQPEGLL